MLQEFWPKSPPLLYHPQCDERYRLGRFPVDRLRQSFRFLSSLPLWNAHYRLTSSCKLGSSFPVLHRDRPLYRLPRRCERYHQFAIVYKPTWHDSTPPWLCDSRYPKLEWQSWCTWLEYWLFFVTLLSLVNLPIFYPNNNTIITFFLINQRIGMISIGLY